MTYSRFALLSVLLLSAPTIAEARAITLAYEATITTVINLDPTQYFAGRNVSGQYTFESLTPDSIPFDPFESQYEGAVLDVSLDLNNPQFDLQQNNRIRILNDNPSNNRDSYIVSVGSPGGGDFFDLVLHDNSMTAFTDTSLPTTPPNLSDFNVSVVLSGGFGEGAL